MKNFNEWVTENHPDFELNEGKWLNRMALATALGLPAVGGWMGKGAFDKSTIPAAWDTLMGKPAAVSTMHPEKDKVSVAPGATKFVKPSLQHQAANVHLQRAKNYKNYASELRQIGDMRKAQQYLRMAADEELKANEMGNTFR